MTFYNLDDRPVSLSPMTPSAKLSNSMKAGVAPASLKAITYKQRVKAAATLQRAFGRRPEELVQLDKATPPQLTILRTEEELNPRQICATRGPTSDETSRNTCASAQSQSYLSEGMSKIKPDSGYIISTDGTMVGMDLGARLLKVSVKKLWVLPAHRCGWNGFNPLQWHVLVFSQNSMSFKEAPTISLAHADQSAGQSQ